MYALSNLSAHIERSDKNPTEVRITSSRWERYCRLGYKREVTLKKMVQNVYFVCVPRKCKFKLCLVFAIGMAVFYLTPTMKTRFDLNCNNETTRMILLKDLGRTGNQLWEYWAAFILAQKYHRHLYVHTGLYQQLNRLLEYHVNTKQWDPTNSSLGCPPNSTRLKPYSFYDFHWPYPENLPNRISIAGFPSAISVALLQEMFQSRPQIRAQMPLNSQLTKEAISYIKKVKKDKYQTVVGIHVRRTDYQLYLNLKFGPAKIADRKYFQSAKTYFRSKYPKPMFIVVSDDPEWCQENLQDEDTFFAGNEKQRTPESDLVLLALSDHLIISYGTFGLSAAFLCRGEVILADHYTKRPIPTHEKLKQVNPPDWKFVSV